MHGIMHLQQTVFLQLSMQNKIMFIPSNITLILFLHYDASDSL